MLNYTMARTSDNGCPILKLKGQITTWLNAQKGYATDSFTITLIQWAISAIALLDGSIDKASFKEINKRCEPVVSSYDKFSGFRYDLNYLITSKQLGQTSSRQSNRGIARNYSIN